MTTYDLIHGDCLAEMQMLMASGSVDLIVTDPPFGMGLTPQRTNGKFNKRKILNDENLLWVPEFFTLAYDVLTETGAAFIFCNHFCVAEFIIGAKSAGFTTKNMLIWDKLHFGMGNNWRPQHEIILLFTKGPFKTKSKNLRSIIKAPRVHHSKTVHPTQKPVELLKQLISEPDYPVNTVFDPFMGSGATGVACAELSKNFVGIELDAEFFSAARDRVQNAYKK